MTLHNATAILATQESLLLNAAPSDSVSAPVATDSTSLHIIDDVTDGSQTNLPLLHHPARQEEPTPLPLTMHPYHLPSGQLIDCKNTLYSHSVAEFRAAANASTLLHYDLNDTVIADALRDELRPFGAYHGSHLVAGGFDVLEATHQRSPHHIVPAPSHDHEDVATGFYKQILHDIRGIAASVLHASLALLSFPSDIDKASDEGEIRSDATSSDIETAPGIHYLVIEPARSEEEGALLETANGSANSMILPDVEHRQMPRRLLWLQGGIVIVAWIIFRLQAGPAASDERALQILEFINGVTLSGQTFTLVDATRDNYANASVEVLALNWLVQRDPLLQWTVPNTTANRYRLQQRYAIATLWFPWSRSGRRFGDRHECEWTGTTCNNHTGNANAVTRIALAGAYGSGSISSDLGLLSAMVHFDISRNDVRGSLPSSIGRWTDLTYFNVSHNRLTGQLPDSIGNWTKLSQFGVAYNAMKGSVPTSTEQWTNLLNFEATGCRLIGSLPDSIGRWTNLVRFHAASNGITGSLPVAVGNWTKVEQVDLSGNSLTGSLPSWLAQWTNLTYLNLESNRFVGSIPQFVGQWTNMVHLHIAKNKMTGSLPNSIGKWSRLTGFHIGSNAFNGSLPESMASWTRLQQFNVAGQLLTGSLPSFIEKWPNLTHFDVTGHKWTGTLPESIGQWVNLTEFRVGAMFYSNVPNGTKRAFTGTLPESIGHWTNLKEFDVSSTALTGTLPKAIGNWTRLDSFRMVGGGFTGSVPDSIASWTSLSSLTIADENLTGAIPTVLCTAVNLSSMRINCERIYCPCGKQRCKCNA